MDHEDPDQDARLAADVAMASQAAHDALNRLAAGDTQARAPTRQMAPAQPPTAATTTVTAATPASPIISAQEQQHRAMWAAAIADVAQEFTDSLPHLAPAQRVLASRGAAAMSTSVTALLSGAPLPRPLSGRTEAIFRPNSV